MRLIELLKISMYDKKDMVNFVNSYCKEYKNRQGLASALFKVEDKSFYEIKRALYKALSKTKVILEPMEVGTRGYFIETKNLIALNPESFNAATIVHEMTHAVQHELGYNFDDYISYSVEEDNYNDYRYQLVEYEAFMMGNTWASNSYRLEKFIKRQIKKGLAI